MSLVAKKTQSKLKNQNFSNQFDDWFSEIENLENQNSKKNIAEKSFIEAKKTEIKEIKSPPVAKVLTKKNKGIEKYPVFSFIQKNVSQNLRKTSLKNSSKILTKEEFLKQNEELKLLKKQENKSKISAIQKKEVVSNFSQSKKSANFSNSSNKFQNKIKTENKQVVNLLNDLEKGCFFENDKKTENFSLNKKNSIDFSQNFSQKTNLTNLNSAKKLNSNLKSENNFSKFKKEEKLNLLENPENYLKKDFDNSDSIDLKILNSKNVKSESKVGRNFVSPSLNNFLQSLKIENNSKNTFNFQKKTFFVGENKLKEVKKNQEKISSNFSKGRKPVILSKKLENSNGIQNYLGSNNHFVGKTAHDFSNRFCETFDNFTEKISHSLSNTNFKIKDLFCFKKTGLLVPRIYKSFAFLSLFFVLTFSFFHFIGNVFAVKENVMSAGEKAKENLKLALSNISNKDFYSSGKNFENAYQEMSFASQEMAKINDLIVFISEFVPKASQLSSGKNVIEVGKYMTHAGVEGNDLVKELNNFVSGEELKLTDISWLEIYRNSMKHISVIFQDVEKANENMEKINISDLPENYQAKFSLAKQLFPTLKNSLEISVSGQKEIEDILGANGPRTYLFLFQNNHEMRATGGFIGSYGLLEISNGKITNFKIDGIFNPDGQLTDRIVPPLPIQKISADWSLHDSNWFPNFPTSAEKAIDFYERTGGQTVDGVITITPPIMREILKITGPIKLKDYDDLEINSENFMANIQTEVEINYNKNKEEEKENKNFKENKEKNEENKTDPKKILADLTPLVFEKLLENKNPKNLAGIVNVFVKSLDERQILIYMRNDFAQEIVRKNGWSGEILQTDKDYLSVINTNINGFKSDGMIVENIEHKAEIFEDGSVIDTITITREHKGGKTGFSWWDAVNSDYMRVYVPKGAKLILAEGQTREINEPRLDYDKLNYEKDNEVWNEEKNMTIDEDSGTRIYEEENKTIFANWVYVSPQEKVRITYKYLLPFKLKIEQNKEGKFSSYAVLYQKQAGSENSKIKSDIIFPSNFKVNWKTNLENENLLMERDLKTDLYHGVVFGVR